MHNFATAFYSKALANEVTKFFLTVQPIKTPVSVKLHDACIFPNNYAMTKAAASPQCFYL